MTEETIPVAASAPEIKTQETTAPAIETVEKADAAPETPEPAATETPAPSEEDPGTDPADESKPKKKGGFQNRIDKLTREKYEEQIRRETVERERDELRQKLNPTPSSDDEPKLDSGKYATLEDFTKAYAEWNRDQGRKQAQQESEQAQQRQAALAVQASLRAREDVARTKYSDFDQTINPVAPIIMNHPVLKQFAIDSESAMDVTYHLAKNPAKLDEITKMSPLNAVRELLKIEAKLTAPPPPKTITKAPDPIKPVGQSEKAPFSPETASMEEYAKWRADQRRKRKG